LVEGEDSISKQRRLHENSPSVPKSGKLSERRSLFEEPDNWLATSWESVCGFNLRGQIGMNFNSKISPLFLVSVQLLDGVGAEIFGVMQLVVIADFTKGTGYFHLTSKATNGTLGDRRLRYARNETSIHSQKLQLQVCGGREIKSWKFFDTL
jgi:hypothetical protein